MAGDETRTPDTHVIHFDGDFPCRSDGTPIQQISHQSSDFNLGHGLTAKHSFSSKPEGGYTDYFHKMATYAAILSGPAEVLKPETSPRTFRTPEAEDDSVFNYTETASDRVGIGALTEKLEGEIIAIIGLGGTGSYILDFVAKTRLVRFVSSTVTNSCNTTHSEPLVRRISRNSAEAPKKVDYLKGIYSRMRRGIIAHAEALGADNLHLLNGITFAFLSMDAGEEKRLVVEKLEALGVAFVDVGMGLELDEGSLGGILRVTTSTPAKRDHVHQGRISFAGGGEKDIYASNIQVADLNALNAVLAVIKWKKLLGFYRDLEQEHHCTYTTDGNMLLNGDLP